MRHLILATLLLTQAGSAVTQVQSAPRYELPACGMEGPVLFVVDPSGHWWPAMRVEMPQDGAWQIVGYDDSRVFCDGVE